jgi:hypothetical protein
MIKRFLEFKQADLEPVKSFKIKDELNPKIWKDFEMNKDIEKKLLQISKEFYEGTDIKAKVIDYTLVGSLCNYNWSEKYSDYDLHILIDYKEISDDIEMVEQLCDLSKKLWNDQHDIKVEGYEVEVMIQNEKDLKAGVKAGKIGGVYSLKDSKWVKKPEKVDFVPDEKAIENKGKSIMMEIDDIELKIDSLKYDDVKKRIKKVWTKIKDLRKKSLDEEGEYGVGNLVFKLLRRNGYIGKIVDIKTKSYDDQFSK